MNRIFGETIDSKEQRKEDKRKKKRRETEEYLEMLGKQGKWCYKIRRMGRNIMRSKERK